MVHNPGWAMNENDTRNRGLGEQKGNKTPDFKFKTKSVDKVEPVSLF